MGLSTLFMFRNTPSALKGGQPRVTHTDLAIVVIRLSMLPKRCMGLHDTKGMECVSYRSIGCMVRKFLGSPHDNTTPLLQPKQAIPVM